MFFDKMVISPSRDERGGKKADLKIQILGGLYKGRNPHGQRRKLPERGGRGSEGQIRNMGIPAPLKVKEKKLKTESR